MRIPLSRLFLLATILAVTFGATSCQKKAAKTVPETPIVQAETAPPPHAEITPPVAEPFPAADLDKSNVETSIDDLNRSGVLKTVYFGYDSNQIDDVAKSTLQANAAWLKSHSKYTVEIGGHCDERGSIGYNVALGDRRATAAKDYIVGLGVSAGQLVAVSYGEERPAVPGSGESAYSKNRRAEFTIKP